MLFPSSAPILTVVAKSFSELLHNVLIHLEKLKQSRPEIAHLISGGLGLFLEKVSLQH